MTHNEQIAKIAGTIKVVQYPGDPDSRRATVDGRVFVAIRISQRLGTRGARETVRDWTVTEHDPVTGKQVQVVAEEVVHIKQMPRLIARCLAAEAQNILARNEREERLGELHAELRAQQLKVNEAWAHARTTCEQGDMSFASEQADKLRRLREERDAIEQAARI